MPVNFFEQSGDVFYTYRELLLIKLSIKFVRVLSKRKFPFAICRKRHAWDGSLQFNSMYTWRRMKN